MQRIDTINASFNAIISRVPADEVLTAAAAADRALVRGQPVGLLHGLPQAIKDTANTRGIRSTYGSPLFAENIPAQDGLAVSRMRDAGAIFVGKTNVPEFGLGSHTYNPIFGATGNAWDPAFSAGGSSGGAAVAVSQRMLPCADGSDMGGSLRNPAAWNNLLALRPSQGRVPLWPRRDSFMAQLVTEGPIARTAEDLALLLTVQSGYNPRVPLSLNEPHDFFSKSLDADLRGRRIGWLGSFGGHIPMEAGVLELCLEALKSLEAAGLSLIELTPDLDWPRVWRCFVVLRQFSLGGEYGPSLDVPASRAKMKPELQWEIEQSRLLKVRDVQRAVLDRTAIYDWVLRQFEDVDYLAMPSAQLFPFPIKWRWPEEIAGKAMDSYHRWMEIVTLGTLCGCPVLNAPAGFGAAGLPMGVQLIGRPRNELSLLQLARTWEQTTPWLQRVPPSPDTRN